MNERELSMIIRQAGVPGPFNIEKTGRETFDLVYDTESHHIDLLERRLQRIDGINVLGAEYESPMSRGFTDPGDEAEFAYISVRVEPDVKSAQEQRVVKAARKTLGRKSVRNLWPEIAKFERLASQIIRKGSGDKSPASEVYSVQDVKRLRDEARRLMTLFQNTAWNNKREGKYSADRIARFLRDMNDIYSFINRGDTNANSASRQIMAAASVLIDALRGSVRGDEQRLRRRSEGSRL